MESASAHIPVFIGHSLRMAVGADESEIIQIVIERIAILVIEFQRRSAAHPLSYAADFTAMASKVEEMAFQRASRDVFEIVFDPVSSFELELTRGRAIFVMPASDRRSAIRARRHRFRMFALSSSASLQAELSEPVANGRIAYADARSNLVQAQSFFNEFF